MWTHKTPFQTPLLTRQSIALHGQMGLFRALNIGRVVGFVGSGVTVGYGRPTWVELVNSIYGVTRDLLDLCFLFKGGALGSGKSDLGHLHALISTMPKNILPASDTLEVIQASLNGLAKSVELEGDQPKNAGETLKLIVEQCESLLASADDLLATQHPELATLVKLRVELRKAIAKAIRDYPTQVIPPLKDCDPIGEIYHRFGVRRFLTVNYDAELERFFQDRAGFDRAVDVGFADLVASSPPSTDVRAPSQRSASDGQGRQVASVTLRDDTVDDLIKFVAFPRLAHAQIFHLHGRLDDPGSLIITEADYQRTYLQRDVTRQTFHEALDALFLGNDVLFIGVGMNEGDLLRPLRQFVANERMPDIEARRIFAILPFNGESEATARAIELKVRFGVQTMFSGEGLPYIKSAAIKHLMTYLTARSAASGTPDPVARRSFLNALRGLLVDSTQDKEAYARKTEHWGSVPLHWSTSWPLSDCSDEDLCRHWPAQFNDPKIKELFGGGLGATPGHATPEELKLLRGHGMEITTAALCEFIRNLSQSKDRWWQTWQERPKESQASYPRLEVSSAEQTQSAENADLDGDRRFEVPRKQAEAQKATPVVWIRHQGRYDFENYHMYNEPSSVMLAARAFAKTVEEKAGSRRILKLIGPRGSGKGAFLHELQLRSKENNSENWSKLFYDGEDGDCYRGAFIAHAAYSPEFSSVVGALVRFVAGLAATDDDVAHARKYIENAPEFSNRKSALLQTVRDASGFVKYPRLLNSNKLNDKPGYEPLWGWRPEIDRLSQLYMALLRYEKTCSGERFFICLGGLDGLCDRNGNGLNPFHRSFFRLLTSSALQKVPFDLVVTSDKPLQDLSAPQVGGKVALSAGHQWHSLPILKVKDRYWLTDVTAATDLVKEPTDPVMSSTTLSLNLRGRLEASVALHNLVSLCAKECRLEGEELGNWLAALNRADLRGGRTAILDEIFAKYREIDGPCWALRGLVLRHLSLFSIPVTFPTLLICPEVRRALELKTKSDKISPPATPESILLEELAVLWRRGLAKRMQVPSAPPDVEDEKIEASLKKAVDLHYARLAKAHAGDAEHFKKVGDALKDTDDYDRRQRYVLHSQLREYLARQMDFSLTDRGERSFFEVSLFCTMPRDLPTPTERHFRMVGDVVQALISHCQSILRQYYPDEVRRRKENRTFTGEVMMMDEKLAAGDVVQMIRAAYSVLRDSFTVGTLSRMHRFEGGRAGNNEPYEVYRSWLRGLQNAASATYYLSKPGSKFSQARPNGNRQTAHQPFYSSEIQWLYNERAVTSFIQGRLYDAIPIFRRARRLSLNFTSGAWEDDAYNGADRRISLNLAIAQIERGNLKKARSLLTELIKRKLRKGARTPSTTKELAVGYLGLCDHLNGQIESARERYTSALEFAKSATLLRTLSIFHRHLADLERICGDTDKAARHLDLAIYAAAEEHQKDILNLALISRARLARDANSDSSVAKLREAQQLLDQTERFADELGIIKIKIESLKVRSEIMLTQGETEHAGRLAARAVGLANLHGNRLRKWSCLNSYARILLARSQRTVARDILVEVSREAGDHGYQLKAVQAEKAIRELFN